LARPFTARLKPYRSTEISAKPPFEPASVSTRKPGDQLSMTRGAVVTDVAVNAEASARPTVRQVGPKETAGTRPVHGAGASDPSVDIGMWPFEGLKQNKQSAAR
jgi:hypothetical protein